MADLRLVLVTPEKTLFDRPVASIRVPMFDGKRGCLSGRAPLVGRTGVGELKLNEVSGGGESYFIDGGFVQVKGEQVSVLTNSAQPVSEISRAKAAKEMEKAEGRTSSNGRRICRSRSCVGTSEKTGQHGSEGLASYDGTPIPSRGEVSTRSESRRT